MIHVLIVLVVAGAVLYLLNARSPMDGKVKTGISAVIVILLLVYILELLGVFHRMPALR